MQSELQKQLGDLRARLGELRERIHRHNQTTGMPPSYQEVVLYLGQCVLEREPDPSNNVGERDDEGNS